MDTTVRVDCAEHPNGGIINQPRVCTNYHIGVDRSVPGHGSDAHPLAKQYMSVVGIRPKILEGLLNISTS